MARVAAAAANGSRLDHVADAGNMVDHLEDEVAAREAAEAMLAAVAAANLTPKQRQVVYLVYEEDMSLPQAARQMQITHQAAWMHHARALRRIRHAHEQLNHEELNREGG